MKRTLTILLLAAAAPLASGDETPAAAPEAKDEIRGLLRAGECEKVLARVADLRAEFPGDPDLLAFEANCRMREGREIERRFDADLYERLHIGLGSELFPAALRDRLTRVDVSYAPKSVRRARKLFLEAAAADPRRADLVVGAAAALIEMGEEEAATRLLSDRADLLDDAALHELEEAAGDFLAGRRLDRAAALARAIEHAQPDSPLGPAIEAQVALARFRAEPALDALERALERAPGDRRVEKDLARLSLVSRRFDRAARLAGAHALEDIDLLLWLALAQSRGKITSAARTWQDLDQRLERAGEEADPAMRRIAGHYLRIARAGREPTAAMRLRAARLFADSGLILPAVTEADAAVTAEPALVEGWALLASLHRRATLFDLAAEELGQALELARKGDGRESAYSEAELELERARVLLALGEGDAAADLYARAAKAGRPAPYEQGLALLSAGKTGEAKRLFAQVAEAGGEKAASARAKLDRLAAD